jgi:hypothetical protein
MHNINVALCFVLPSFSFLNGNEIFLLKGKGREGRDMGIGDGDGDPKNAY